MKKKPFHYPLNLYTFFFWTFLFLLYTLYSYGFNASFQFDDYANLNWLNQNNKQTDLLAAIFNGQAGPLGRPISLASYLIDRQYWPVNSIPFHKHNTFIHLINTCLLFSVISRIQKLISSSNSYGLIMFACCIWASTPILASTSMIVIQRMTLLSASFVLMGLWLYLIGKQQLFNHQKHGLLIIIIAIYPFTLLAALCKENGALLPFFIASVEFCLLSSFHKSSDFIQKRIRILLAIPILLLFSYLCYKLFSINEQYIFRDFNLSQRLQTESVILWKYLYYAFIPDISVFGPFHDDHPIYSIQSHPIITTLSLIAWFITILAAILIRRKQPLALFAVSWFLAGHLLESSIFPLELYFEHRNYLPLIGPFFALTSITWKQFQQQPALKICLFSSYLILNLFLLSQTTKIWGNNTLSAQTWSRWHPHSVRAQQFLANVQLKQQQTSDAYETISKAKINIPNNSALIIQKILLECSLKQYKKNPTALTNILAQLKTSPYDSSAIYSLNELINLYMANSCTEVDELTIHSFIDTLLSNTRFTNRPHTKHHLHHIKARLYEHKKQLYPTIHQLELALADKTSLDTFLQISSILIQAGYCQLASKTIDDAYKSLPKNPITQSQWKLKLGKHKETFYQCKTSN